MVRGWVLCQGGLVLSGERMGIVSGWTGMECERMGFMSEWTGIEW